MTNIRPTIHVDRLSKSFGELRAVDEISFDVSPGEVLGFLGPNGAGKTTVMRILTCLLSADSGTAEVCGLNVKNRDTTMLSRIGYLPGIFQMYPNLTGEEFVRFIARIRKTDCVERAHELAQRIDLDLSRKSRELSKGNRQKLGVVAAFMHDPEVLILDEPTSGLDPIVQQEFEAILAETKARGAAILLSSHVLSEVEHLSDRVAILNAGKIVLLDDIAEIKRRAMSRIEFEFSEEVSASNFTRLPQVFSAVTKGSRVLCEVQGEYPELMQVAADLNVLRVRTQEPSLEEIFLGLVELDNHKQRGEL